MRAAASRILIAVSFLVPLTDAVAGSIGTIEAVQGRIPEASQARDAAGQRLVASGVERDAARARTAAMTDEEAALTARNSESAPAGGIFGGSWTPVLLVAVIAGVIYWKVHAR